MFIHRVGHGTIPALAGRINQCGCFAKTGLSVLSVLSVLLVLARIVRIQSGQFAARFAVAKVKPKFALVAAKGPARRPPESIWAGVFESRPSQSRESGQSQGQARPRSGFPWRQLAGAKANTTIFWLSWPQFARANIANQNGLWSIRSKLHIGPAAAAASSR